MGSCRSCRPAGHCPCGINPVSGCGGAANLTVAGSVPPGGRPPRTGLRPQFTRNHERNQPHNSTRDYEFSWHGRPPAVHRDCYRTADWYPRAHRCLLSSRSGVPSAHIVVEKSPPMLPAGAPRGVPDVGYPTVRGWNAAELPRVGPHGGGLSISPRLSISHDSLARQHLPPRYMVAGGGRTGPRDLPLQCCATSTSMLECPPSA